MFRTVFCPSSGVFHCTRRNGICHTGLPTACEQLASRISTDPSWSLSQAVSKPYLSYASIWFYYKNAFCIDTSRNPKRRPL